jgi:peptidoglycan hydrolase-like protein with peptidoglycan-binding domain
MTLALAASTTSCGRLPSGPTDHGAPAPGTSTTQVTVAPTSTLPPAPDLRRGDTGAAVTALQGELAGLGYWLGPVDGSFGSLTEQAVLAVQKAAHLSATGVVDSQTRAALDYGVRPTSHTQSGSAIEVDLSDQLVLIVSSGQVQSVLNTSTGNGKAYTTNGVTSLAVTPVGTFAIQRRVDGWDFSPLGVLWRPAYFSGGVAVHGYSDVPAYPASHGCVRVSLAAMDWLWSTGAVAIGTPVLVY